MRAVDLIRRKRDGQPLSPAEIRWLVESYVRGETLDEQMSAFSMAVFFRGMDRDELAALVDAMIASGEVIDLSEVHGPKVDKHSTGGVGDKTSICLAPLVAACGVAVPMISGRGLGHTGGTLDKLAAIPGLTTQLAPSTFVALVRTHGLAFGAQTEQLVPADKRLYALRDVTATVESIPLIAASIMSKKLAEGIDGLVLDVKVGGGAFMKTVEDARGLADALIGIGDALEIPVRALLTDMDQVLGRAVGNANETWEAVEVLRGEGPSDLAALTVELGAEMLVLGEVAVDIDEGRRRIEEAIDQGAGLEYLRRIVTEQGGDARVLDARTALPVAPYTVEMTVEGEGGSVRGFDTEAIGRAAMVLGAGRRTQTESIDPRVGLEVHVRRGERVERGQPWVRVEYADEARLAACQAILREAIQIGAAPQAEPPLVLERRATRRRTPA